MSCWGIAEYVSLLSLVVIAITAGAIIWYSLETRKLRIATEGTRKEAEGTREEAERAREIEFHPWLNGSNLVLDKDPGLNILIWLPIKNRGKTPALKVVFQSEFMVNGQRPEPMSYRNVCIAPGDTLHCRIGQFNTSDHGKTARISVVVKYSTHMGGSGEMKHGFLYGGGNWWNADGDYRVLLSTGEEYPPSPRPNP